MITLNDIPQTLEKKLVAVISDKLDAGTAMNALAHMSLGLGAQLGVKEALMCDYKDGSGISHQAISAYPYIILKGRLNKIREAVTLAREQNLLTIDFVNTMTEGSYTDQLQLTSATPYEELEFYGAAFYGNVEAISNLTKKFSLFK